MSRIRIRNFGPIKQGFGENEGWIDIKKVTVFIGDQGSGKSTVAKLITTFIWIEKALTRGDYDAKWFTRKNKLKNQFLTYFRLENYFHINGNHFQTKIDYQGDSYHITFENGNLNIESARNGAYPLPQIMYVPAERNFIANVKAPKALKLTSDSLLEFVTEFDNAKNELKGSMKLPVNNVDVEYNKQHDIVYLRGDNYRIKLTEAASGYQSLVPLYLVSWFLANSVKKQSDGANYPMSSDELERFRKGVGEIWSNQNLSEDQRRAALSVLSSRFKKTAFINIVEEPEQNLYPTSQWKLLISLLEFNNMNSENKLIMTTHSPYLINYLTLSVKAFSLSKKIQQSKKKELNNRLGKIVPFKALINPDDLIIYQLDNYGNITRLKDYKGLPSDENYLNKELGESNELFAQLLEIQQSL